MRHPPLFQIGIILWPVGVMNEGIAPHPVPLPLGEGTPARSEPGSGVPSPPGERDRMRGASSGHGRRVQQPEPMPAPMQLAPSHPPGCLRHEQHALSRIRRRPAAFHPWRGHLLREYPRAQSRRSRRARGRDRHADRLERRGQIHAHDDDLRRSARAIRPDRFRRARHRQAAHARNHAAFHRAVARRPAHLSPHDGA